MRAWIEETLKAAVSLRARLPVGRGKGEGRGGGPDLIRWEYGRISVSSELPVLVSTRRIATRLASMMYV